MLPMTGKFTLVWYFLIPPGLLALLFLLFRAMRTGSDVSDSAEREAIPMSTARFALLIAAAGTVLGTILLILIHRQFSVIGICRYALGAVCFVGIPVSLNTGFGGWLFGKLGSPVFGLRIGAFLGFASGVDILRLMM